jgi:hypothetical protein
MSHWSEFATNPAALSMYNTPPSLDNVEFLQCRFIQSGAAFEIDLSLTEMPQRQPPRWPETANAVSLTFQLWATLSSSVSMSQITNGRNIACSFRKSGNGLLFECSGSGLNIRVECNSLRIAHSSGYSLVAHDEREGYA